MVKSSISKKQSKASGFAKPTGSETTIKAQSPSIASSNFRAMFEDHPNYNEAIQLMIKFIPSHPLFGAFDSFNDVVPLFTLFKCAFSACHLLHNLQEVHLHLIDESQVMLTKTKFLEAINLRVPSTTKFFSPSTPDITTAQY